MWQAGQAAPNRFSAAGWGCGSLMSRETVAALGRAVTAVGVVGLASEEDIEGHGGCPFRSGLKVNRYPLESDAFTA